MSVPLICPHCGHSEAIHHLDWTAVTCGGCEESIEIAGLVLCEDEIPTIVSEKARLLDVLRASGFSEVEIATTDRVITSAYEDTFRDRRKGGAT